MVYLVRYYGIPHAEKWPWAYLGFFLAESPKSPYRRVT
jgi:hypothetical protein